MTEDRTLIDTFNQFYAFSHTKHNDIFAALVKCLGEEDLDDFLQDVFKSYRDYSVRSEKLTRSEWNGIIINAIRLASKYKRDCYNNVISTIIDYFDRRERTNG